MSGTAETTGVAVPGPVRPYVDPFNLLPPVPYIYGYWYLPTSSFLPGRGPALDPFSLTPLVTYTPVVPATQGIVPEITPPPILELPPGTVLWHPVGLGIGAPAFVSTESSSSAAASTVPVAPVTGPLLAVEFTETVVCDFPPGSTVRK